MGLVVGGGSKDVSNNSNNKYIDNNTKEDRGPGYTVCSDRDTRVAVLDADAK